MITNDLNSDVFAFSLLNKVNKQIVDWKLEPVIGKGLYSKSHSIAYLEIKMYETKSEEFISSHVIWNIPEDQFAKYHAYYKSDIEESLNFFLKYISALKGETVHLTFEINDTTFDPTATRRKPFEKATLYSIINCFDSSVLKLNDVSVQSLKKNFDSNFSSERK